MAPHDVSSQLSQAGAPCRLAVAPLPVRIGRDRGPRLPVCLSEMLNTIHNEGVRPLRAGWLLAEQLTVTLTRGPLD